MKNMWSALLILFGVYFVQTSYASNNPFKKDKAYHFGSDVTWHKKADTAVKSGQVRGRNETLYFHLTVNEKQLKLRLSKNDISGDILNSRHLQNLTIKDIRLDERRLAVFQWCLDNQERPSRYLKQYAFVPSDTCINADGDVIIQLDKNTRNSLQRAKQITFVLEPFSREETVSFDLQGLDTIMAKIKPPVVVAKPVKKVFVVHKKNLKQVKPRPKKVVVPLKKPKICHAKPPAEFKQQVKSIAYPCNNKTKKSKAHAVIAAKVAAEKEKIAKLEAEKEKRLEMQRVVDEEDARREEEWAIKQKARWIARCQKHWAKGTSPCFCKKYIKEAPTGVKNTCKK